MYLMPVKPYTIAARFVHMGQYGHDANDPRLVPAFLGSRQFVRGYGWSSLRCRPDVGGECGAYDDLLASRLVVGNVEMRVPIMGMPKRELRYGPVPAEAFVFADSGYVWAQSQAFTFAEPSRRLIGSFGVGARLNAFGLPIEIAAVRAVTAPARGWSFDFSFRPGF
jgi:outer membrane protein assembly factor BamA